MSVRLTSDDGVRADLVELAPQHGRSPRVAVEQYALTIHAADAAGMRRETSQTTASPEPPLRDGCGPGQPARVQVLGRSGCRQGLETAHGPDLALRRLGANGMPGQGHLAEPFTAEFGEVSLDPVEVEQSQRDREEPGDLAIVLSPLGQRCSEEADSLHHGSVCGRIVPGFTSIDCSSSNPSRRVACQSLPRRRIRRVFG